MEKLAAVARSVAAEAGPRSRFLQPSDNDELLGITLALAGEVATLYERLDVLERVLEAGFGLSRETLDGFVASPEVLAQRGQWHDAFVTRLMRPLTQEIERLKAQGGAPVPESSGGD